ncbi:unnamed protein product [marine sediment metagenome]|uniref:Uncharacterized protein n=1 Tax=marine sediment metagenome TaxID=412755 RepID=X0T8L0_9ZZZZ
MRRRAKSNEAVRLRRIEMSGYSPIASSPPEADCLGCLLCYRISNAFKREVRVDRIEYLQVFGDESDRTAGPD